MLKNILGMQAILLTCAGILGGSTFAYASESSGLKPPVYGTEDQGYELSLEAMNQACLATHEALSISTDYPDACQHYRIPMASLASKDPIERTEEIAALFAIQAMEMACRATGERCGEIPQLRKRYADRFVR